MTHTAFQTHIPDALRVLHRKFDEFLLRINIFFAAQTAQTFYRSLSLRASAYLPSHLLSGTIPQMGGWPRPCNSNAGSTFSDCNLRIALSIRALVFSGRLNEQRHRRKNREVERHPVTTKQESNHSEHPYENNRI